MTDQTDRQREIEIEAYMRKVDEHHREWREHAATLIDPVSRAWAETDQAEALRDEYQSEREPITPIRPGSPEEVRAERGPTETDAEWLYGNTPGGLRQRAAEDLAAEFGTDAEEWLI